VLGSILAWGAAVGATIVALRFAVPAPQRAGVMLAVGFVAVIWSLIQFGMTSPLKRLREGLRRVQGGDYDVRLRASGPRELREVAAGFNRMAEIVGEQRQRLESLVATDALTGLANHRHFHERLGAEIERARRYGGQLALVSLDLDDFKKMNDTYGHPYGDEILRAVGEQLDDAVRAADLAARLGGEEFALILPGADADFAYAAAERVRVAVEAVPVRGSKLSCSAGVACFPTDAEDADTLLRFADGAMYWAKRAGKGRTRRYDPDNVATAWTDDQREQIEALLRQDEPVRPLFQPIVDLALGTVLGYEALARFPGHPGRTPSAVFSQAHGCGLGAELEAAAIRAALAPANRPFDTWLALNVSPSALAAPPMAEALPSDLRGFVIELTEHELVAGDETLLTAIADLRERGGLVAVDDAGAGYSGLMQVMRVRPDVVKLDRDLTEGVHADPAKTALVEAFVRFARRTGTTLCAEGVESLEDLSALADLDVSWGQGYILGRPEPPWPAVDERSAEACRAALSRALRTSSSADAGSIAGDRRLEHLSARLAGARSRDDLDSAVALIAAELHAQNVILSRLLAGEGILETLADNSRKSAEDQFAVDEFPATARVLESQVAAQVIVGDPESDPAEVELLLELGYRSLLMVPVISRGSTVGLLEAFAEADRPWTRTEINRARVIAHQFGAVIAGSFSPEAGSIGRRTA
jgi:diguanylate cyclase (GGDEF)-like protein